MFNEKYNNNNNNIDKIINLNNFFIEFNFLNYDVNTPTEVSGVFIDE